MQRQKGGKVKKEHKKLLFSIELILAVLLAAGCGIAGMSNLLWESNGSYPASTDLLGHMTKVIYIADQLIQGHLPSWFPYWYNGSTATQYYVPLSYYGMVPVYLATHNIMLTFKIFCAGVMGIGGLGVWAFCYKKIGRFCGLVGIVAYCLQPILLTSLYREGVIAQGPIYAIAPWFLLLILSCAQKPSRGNYIGTTALAALLILSHAMNAFMICFTVELTLLILIILRKIKVRNFIIASSGIVFAGLLTAFWSVTGAFGLENPGIPYLLSESAPYTTADLKWFLPGTDAFFYFSIVITALSAVGVLCYFITSQLKKNNNNQEYSGLACIILTLITMTFSFGRQIPGFRYLPYASNMVPGRILTLTAVTGAILSVYVIYTLWRIPRVKFIFRMLAFAILGLIIYDSNPYKESYQTLSSKDFNSMTTLTANQNDNFDKGRYHWIGSLNNSEILFSFLNHYNISGGENIEGTLHNQTIYNDYIALPLMKYDYILKQTAFWNVRYLLLSSEYSGIGTQLEDKLDFYKTRDNRGGFTLYASNHPSSYYLTDARNALVISQGMQGFSIQFPNFVQGSSNNLWDYTDKELLQYRMIYIIEPKIHTMTQKTEFERKVTRLVNAGVKVMIEPAPSKNFDLFQVHAEDETFEASPELKATNDCPYELPEGIIVNNSHLGTTRNLSGLDQVYAQFDFNQGRIKNAVLGTKKVGNGEVLFAGAHMSQYLDSVYSRNNGVGAVDFAVEENSRFFESVYSAIFSYYDVEEDYLPRTFETVTKQNWNYQGGSFAYQSNEAKTVTVSLTYTSRWTATVDRKKIEVGQRENLINLKLPAGKHKVELHYGVTVYGKIGYLISVAALVLFLLVLLLWRWNMRLVEKKGDSLRNYLQLDEEKAVAVSPETAMSEQRMAALEEAAAGQENIMEATEENRIAALKEATEQEELRENLKTVYEPCISRSTVNENGITVDIIAIDEDKKEAGKKASEDTLSGKHGNGADRKVVPKVKKYPERPVKKNKNVKVFNSRIAHPQATIRKTVRKAVIPVKMRPSMIKFLFGRPISKTAGIGKLLKSYPGRKHNEYKSRGNRRRYIEIRNKK